MTFTNTEFTFEFMTEKEAYENKKNNELSLPFKDIK